MGKLIKKVARLVLTSTICTLVLVSTAFAYDAQSVSFSFDGNGTNTGGVDGSSNGKYYSLTTGNVTLALTNTISGGTSTIPSDGLECSVILYRERFGADKDYGYRKILYTSEGNSTTSRWVVDTDSTDYYLYVTGGNAFHYDSQGTFYDYYR